MKSAKIKSPSFLFYFLFRIINKNPLPFNCRCRPKICTKNHFILFTIFYNLKVSGLFPAISSALYPLYHQRSSFMKENFNKIPIFLQIKVKKD